MGNDIGIPVSNDAQAAVGNALRRHGPPAKVNVLPFARYQMPTDVIRMPAKGLMSRAAAF
ncbi:MAG: hypothetical protein AAF493_08750 [Pseudomonadota bacterium]